MRSSTQFLALIGAVTLSFSSAAQARGDRTPSVSPDGNWIAFQSTRSGNADIYIVHRSGSGLRQLTTNEAVDGDPTWSRNGQTIAFYSERDGNSEIYSIGKDRTDLKRLTNNESADRHPYWEPDGKGLLYTSDRDGGQLRRILDGADTVLSEKIDWRSGISFGPRGRIIAGIGLCDGDNDVVHIDPGFGTILKRVAQNPARDSSPAWSPDSFRIAFASQRDGDWDIYDGKADGSEVVRLTTATGNDRTPNWFTGGKEILFASDRNGEFELFLMSSDGSDQRPLRIHAPMPKVLREEAVAWLSNNTSELKTSDLTPESNDDLAPIVAAIGDARVVALGGASHGDGATLEMKARLARHLMEHEGFSVLAFESGFYEAGHAWDLIQDGMSVDKSINGALQGIWARSQTVQDLVQWMADNSTEEAPLHFAGYDAMPSGAYFSELSGVLQELAVSAGINQDLIQRGLSQLNDLAGSVKRMAALTEEERNDLLVPLRELRIELQRLGGETAFLAQSLYSFEVFLEMALTGDMSVPGGGPGLNFRDRQMADNVSWLLENLEPNAKVILWGASTHLSKNRKVLAVNSGRWLKPCGDLLRKLDVGTYFLGFTSREGVSGPGPANARSPRLPAPLVGSLEMLWGRTDHNLSFLNLSAMEETPKWMRSGFSTRAFTHDDTFGDWTQVLDGILFIREMTPVKIVGR